MLATGSWGLMILYGLLVGLLGAVLISMLNTFIRGHSVRLLSRMHPPYHPVLTRGVPPVTRGR